MLTPRPWWLFIFPRYFWVTINPHIYYPSYLENVEQGYPHIIAHESVHIKQQSQGNALWWYLKYIFSGKFRLAMEAEAIAAEITYDQTHYDANYARKAFENYCSALSSWNYMWASTYNEAVTAINAHLENKIVL